MAKFFNPTTGQMEDDMVPNPAPAPAPAPVIVQDVPAQAAVPAMPAPRMDVTRTASTSTTQAKPTAQEAGLQAEQREIEAKKIADAEKAAELGRQKAQEQAAEADERAKITAEKQARTDQILADGEKELAARKAEADAQFEALKSKAEIKDFWESKSTGDKILAGLAVALGGWGQALSGDKENRALSIIQKQAEEDFQRQQQNFLNQKGLLDEARKGSKDAQDAIQKGIDLLNIGKAAAYETIADKYKAMGAKRGIPEAELEGSKVVTGLRDASLKTRQEYEKGLRQSVNKQVQETITERAPEGPKPATEGQIRSAEFSNRMAGAMKEYNKVGGISQEGMKKVQEYIQKNTTIDKLSGVPIVPAASQMFKDLNVDLPQKDRQALSAMNDIITSTLRKDSGAAIGADEYQRELNILFPSVGDEKETTAAKDRARLRRLAAMQKSARGDITLESVEQPPEEVKVPMVAPNGSTVLVPESKVKEAESRGAKRK